MAVGDRFILSRYLPLQDIGFYSMGVSFGLIPKIVLGAFEYAWAPFYYATAREPDGRAVRRDHDLRLRRARADDGRAFRDRRRPAGRRRRPASTPAAAGVVAWTAVGVFF